LPQSCVQDGLVFTAIEAVFTALALDGYFHRAAAALI